MSVREAVDPDPRNFDRLGSASSLPGARRAGLAYSVPAGRLVVHVVCVVSAGVSAPCVDTRGLFLGTESSLAGQAGSLSGHNDKCSIVFGVMATRFDLSLSLSLSPCLRLCPYMTVCVR